MNKIQQMIEELCPEGVEYVKLGNLLGYEQPTKYIVESKNYIDNGVPVLTAGQSFILGYTDEREGIYKATKENPVIIFDDFTTSFHWVDFDFKVKSSAMKMLKPTSRDCSFRFVYYAMKCIKYETMEHSRQWISKYSSIEIPLPPLPIQSEIVKILDKFSALQAELVYRKQQYEYYRDRLIVGSAFPLSEGTCHPHRDNETQNTNGIDKHVFNSPCSDNVKWMKMSEVGTFTRGSGLQKKDFTESGVGCIHYGQIYTYYGLATTTTKSFVVVELAKKLKTVHKNDIVFAVTSENVEDLCKCVAWLGEEDIVTGGHAVIFSHNQNAEYLAYYFQTEHFAKQKRKYAKGVKVMDIKASDMEHFLIPVPPLAEQERIAGILDRFEALTTSISEGLPAEIAARRQQYEHYRDKLLTFKKKVA